MFCVRQTRLSPSYIKKRMSGRRRSVNTYCLKLVLMLRSGLMGETKQ
ncbi:hypothetical protein OK016_10915 [Vibrio chagasii]|nr:hypothetical protein [Vibrio chagasii]